MASAVDQKKLVAARRKHEDMIIGMEHTLADAANTFRKANFEIKTSKKIERRTKAVCSSASEIHTSLLNIDSRHIR
jgi:hypothetical protein